MPTGAQTILARAVADALLPDDDISLLEPGEREHSMLSWSRWAPSGSTAIVQVSHRLRDGMMTVRFTNGPVDYLFWDVDRELFRQWKRVRSAGAFYHRRIKGRYGIS
jgi:hypothetical protein